MATGLTDTDIEHVFASYLFQFPMALVARACSVTVQAGTVPRRISSKTESPERGMK